MGKNKIIGLWMIMIIIALPIYIPTTQAVSFESNPSDMIIQMDKIMELEVEVNKMQVIFEADTILEPEELNENESVIITLIKEKEYPGEEDFKRFLEYKPNSEYNQIKLVPGNYSMNLNYILQDVTIPARDTTYCKLPLSDDWEESATTFATGAGGIVAGAAMTTAAAAAASAAAAGTSIAAGVTGAFAGGGALAFIGPIGWIALGLLAGITILSMVLDCEDLGAEEVIHIDEQNLDAAIIGGAIGSFIVTDNLYEKERITFNVFNSIPPRTIEELNFEGMVSDLSKEYPHLIVPELT